MRRYKKDRAWTTAEHESFLRLRSEGKNRTEIAAALGRSWGSIGSRITWVNRIARAGRRIGDFGIIPTPPRETRLINHSEVPGYYAVGWRFAGFSNDLYLFEWPSGHRPPQWPEQRRAA